MERNNFFCFSTIHHNMYIPYRPIPSPPLPSPVPSCHTYAEIDLTEGWLVTPRYPLLHRGGELTTACSINQSVLSSPSSS
mmetsp:Transcript_31178/g.52546  ORF Transcript_31178/g.52546 Transcript_31178/m.52546 type:complete len:80 (+) Transcript_31178:125-364(+)